MGVEHIERRWKVKITVSKMMSKNEVDGDTVKVVASNGDSFTLWECENGDIRLDCNGVLVIEPRASNLVTLRRRK